MNSDAQSEIVNELYELRKQGTDFTELRKKLIEKGFENERIKEILAEVNELELSRLTTGLTQINPNVFLALALITLFSTVILAYYIQKLTQSAPMQFLNAIPIAGSVVLFYNYWIYKNRSRKK